MREGKPLPRKERSDAAGEDASRTTFAKRVGEPDTRRIGERRSNLVTGLSEVGGLCQLEPKICDGPLGLGHPHRRSRWRENVDAHA